MDPLNLPATNQTLDHLMLDDVSAGDQFSSEEAIARAYLPFARHLAKRFVRPGVEADDLLQVASLALIKAIRGYDPERGAFAPYAKATISGELKKHLRDHCWSIRPPRRVQELHAQIGAATETLAQDGRRVPGTEALAKALDADVSDISEALAARNCFTPTSLDRLIGPGSGSLSDLVPDAATPYEAVDDAVSLAQLCVDLTDSDRELLYLTFFEDKSQREIARVMGISQMAVCRRLNRLLDTLRRRAGLENVA